MIKDLEIKVPENYLAIEEWLYDGDDYVQIED